MTTSVWFDLDGTLLDYTTSFGELFAQTLPVSASDEMVATYSEHVLSGIRQMAERPYRRAFESVGREYDLDIDPGALTAEYIEREAKTTRVPEPVTRLVESIADRHQTGILTNGTGRMQRRKIERHGLDGPVDSVVVSNELGSRKPSTDIFEEAKKRLPAETVIYIGDTFEEDILPARSAGFDTVYIGEETRSATPVTARRTEELAAVLLPLMGELPTG